GASNCSFTNAPTLMVIDGVVLAVLVPSVTSVAVIVRVPAVLSVTLKLPLPAARAALAGRPALLSDDVIPTRSVTVGTMFQFASTALTITLKAAPAVCTVGVPVFPVAEPGAAVSPGASTCNFAKTPTLTVIEGLVFAVLVPSRTSDRVRVRLPTVRKVTLRVLEPD